MKRSDTLRFLLLVLLALALQAGAARAAATPWVGNQRAAARLISAVQATGSGTTLDAGVQLRLAPGWHAYWRTPGDAGVPPTFDWSGSENVASVTVAWPAPSRLVVSGLQNAVYEDGVVLPLSVALAHPDRPARLHLALDYAACAQVCVPYHADLDLALPAGLATPGPEAALIAAGRARVPADLSAAGLTLTGAAVAPAPGGAVLALRLASLGAPLHAPDVFVEGVPDLVPGQPKVTLAQGGHVATLDVPIPGAEAAKLAGKTLDLTVTDGARAAEARAVPVAGRLPPLGGQGLPLGIIGVALLGGLILNLMPCVLPVLSLKLLALVGYAGAARRHARLGLLATASGVVVSFLAIAAVLIGLKATGAAIGWGIQFQVPWFLAGMALLTTLFAASLWDWLPIGLPGGVERAVGSVRGHGRFSDAFLLGAFATLLAASCSAPFVGTAVGFALARGPADIAAVFLALGLGMGAPFLAAAAVPGLVAFLPRPGAWMIWLRRVLGVALLGTAGWLLSVLALEAGTAAALVAGAALLVL
ncbi:MAG TPA: protein-disulfide reductase DsbD domain-containing protein, partial [Acetobacteraceae bacterium]|nr:protein-disulfide reductase DsbD domain-containing protein [Acetobacteraceae bacterium]